MKSIIKSSVPWCSQQWVAVLALIVFVSIANSQVRFLHNYKSVKEQQKAKYLWQEICRQVFINSVVLTDCTCKS